MTLRSFSKLCCDSCMCSPTVVLFLAWHPILPCAANQARLGTPFRPKRFLSKLIFCYFLYRTCRFLTIRVWEKERCAKNGPLIDLIGFSRKLMSKSSPSPQGRKTPLGRKEHVQRTLISISHTKVNGNVQNTRGKRQLHGICV